MVAHECQVAMLEMDDHLQALNIEEMKVAVKPTENLEKISLDDNIPGRITHIGMQADPSVRKELALFLKNHQTSSLGATMTCQGLIRTQWSTNSMYDHPSFWLGKRRKSLPKIETKSQPKKYANYWRKISLGKSTTQNGSPTQSWSKKQMAKREKMKEYLNMVKRKVNWGLSAKFVQIPRKKNKQVDCLAKVASIEYMDVICLVLSFVQYSPAIDKVEVQMIPLGTDWMVPIASYLRNGMLPKNRNASYRLKVQ